MSTILNINDLDLTKKYSYAEYLKFRFKERLELLKGYVFKMSPAPSRRHQEILWNLTGFFSRYFKDKNCRAYFAPFDVRFPQKPSDTPSDIFTVLQPDLCVICDLTKLDDRGCLGAPDLVIEILSAGNSKKEINQKFEIYQDAGVREYWIIQPEYEMVMVYLYEKGKFTGKAPASSSGLVKSYIFPGLEVDLEELFAF